MVRDARCGIGLVASCDSWPRSASRSAGGEDVVRCAADGRTVISHTTFLPGSRRRALVTSPRVTVKAWFHSVLKLIGRSSLNRSSKVKTSCPLCEPGASWMVAVSGCSDDRGVSLATSLKPQPSLGDLVVAIRGPKGRISGVSRSLVTRLHLIGCRYRRGQCQSHPASRYGDRVDQPYSFIHDDDEGAGRRYGCTVQGRVVAQGQRPAVDNRPGLPRQALLWSGDNLRRGVAVSGRIHCHYSQRVQRSAGQDVDHRASTVYRLLRDLIGIRPALGSLLPLDLATGDRRAAVVAQGEPAHGDLVAATPFGGGLLRSAWRQRRGLVR